ncbi:MAG: thioredoxin domain-containing protein [Saprospiraceae bacterium]
MFLFIVCWLKLGLCLLSAQSPWNHLRYETSPYLKQHAHNPVDWYPWNQTALEKAIKENKLLVISIGYASCHWCHVMESESFSDTTVSRMMNTSYVSIKVDRETRPDIDQVYISACQLINHDGCGWPLNVIALPDGRPVYIGTYMKKPQWIEVINHFANQYRDQPDKMRSYANDLTNGIQSNTFHYNDSASIHDSMIHDQVNRILIQLDDPHGGIRGTPKFPLPALFDFLFSYGKKYQRPEVIQSVYTLLDHLITGGIYDMLEGGISRYSLDEEWKVPHFEKMLYDNAQLISLFAHAYQESKNGRYKKTVISCIDFLNHQLKSPEGAFYSSFDADAIMDNSKEDPALREGKYYIWTKDEIAEALADPVLIEKCNRWFNILEEGNALSDLQYSMLGKNVLSFHRTNSKEVYPHDFSDSLFSIMKSRLLKSRQKRTRPARDEKIICAWNALTISALADAYMATGVTAYKTQAITTGGFIWNKMHQNNKLYRIFQKNKNNSMGFLEDYAHTGLAFVKLYQITFDERWLKRAEQLKDEVLVNFSADTIPFFYYTSKQQPSLITKRFDIQDQEIPSSNAAMARLLMILGDYNANTNDKARAEIMIKTVANKFTEGVINSYYYWLENALLLLDPPYEIAIVGNQYEDLARAMTNHFIPYSLWCGGKKEGHLPLLKNKLQKGTTTIYVCQNNMCLLPVHEVAEALKLIK